MNAGVLIHTDNVELFLLLRHILETEGFPARICVHPRELLEAIQTEKPVAVLLDCSKRVETIDFYRQIKSANRDELAVAAFTNSPEVELTREFDATEIDIVIRRPFDPDQLLAFLKRLRVALPKASGSGATPELIFRYADIEMNVTRVRVMRNGHTVRLSALQFKLLLHLIRSPDVVYSREDLIAAAWARGADVEPRTVDIHIGHLRRALNRHGPNVIRTVRSVGYSLEAVAHT